MKPQEEEKPTSFKERLEVFAEELEFGEKYLTSINSLNNWLLGIPTTTLLLLLVNFNFFLIDGELYKPHFFIGLLIINSIVVLVFGLFKLIYEDYKVKLEYVRMQYGYVARKGDAELGKLIEEVSEECENQNLETQNEIQKYYSAKQNEMGKISDKYGEETSELIFKMIRLKKPVLVTSFVYYVVYSFALFPPLGTLTYVILYVIENY